MPWASAVPVTSRTPSASAAPLTSRHREATGDGQRLAGDEAGIVGGEEDHGRSHVVGDAEPAPRDHALEALRELRALLRELLLEERRVGRTGAHAVYVDAMARDLARHGLGERDEPALGRGVHGLARRADAAGVGGDDHDLAG